MNELRKQENLDELRKRLYARDAVKPKLERHELTDETADVATKWETPEAAKAPEPEPEPVKPQLAPSKEYRPKRRNYRYTVTLGSLMVFFFGAGLAVLYQFINPSNIASENIGLIVAGPSTLAGGETMALQVSVSNQNSVPIESATLIMNYPAGTRSVNETGRELFEERIPINSVGSGEVQNVPVRVAVFGSESEEKEVSATIEYRIEGSNGTFYKDSPPLRFRITSTPVVLRVDNVERVAAGQIVELTLTAQSNSSNPQNNLLVQAEYPNGFDFEESFPPPVFGEDVWRIDELLPEESEDITVRGTIRGLTEETFRINFDVGPADTTNQYRTSSSLTRAFADFTIERPFIDVGVAINGDTSDEVIIPAGQSSNVKINVRNTLDETVYDMVVEVVPGGNALRQESISVDKGFYDSNNGTIRWEVSSNPDFNQVTPGSFRNLEFEILPVGNLGTAAFDLVVNVYARRISESTAQEQLIGSSVAVGKFSSEVLLGGQIGRNGGVFSDTGPIPPRVGQTTTYTVSLVAEAGVNDLSDTQITTSLPLYITWLDQYQGPGEVTYNTVSKQLEWRPGDIEARQRKQLTFQVSLTPSVSQIGAIPTLINSQQLRASDRFTGATLRASAPALTTALSTELGFAENDGMVAE
jgi:hypothetical protein